MKHFLVTFGEYSDTTILGVFTTLEKAKAAGVEYAKYSSHYCADLYELDIDRSYAGDYYKALFYGKFEQDESDKFRYHFVWKPCDE